MLVLSWYILTTAERFMNTIPPKMDGTLGHRPAQLWWAFVVIDTMAFLIAITILLIVPSPDNQVAFALRKFREWRFSITVFFSIFNLSWKNTKIQWDHKVFLLQLLTKLSLVHLEPHLFWNQDKRFREEMG